MVSGLHVSSSVNQASRLIDGSEPCWQSSGSQGKVGDAGASRCLITRLCLRLPDESLRECIATPPISTHFASELIIILTIPFDFYCQILNSVRSPTSAPISRGCDRVRQFLVPPRETHEFRVYSGEKFFLIRPHGRAGLREAVALALTCGHVTWTRRSVLQGGSCAPG